MTVHNDSINNSNDSTIDSYVSHERRSTIVRGALIALAAIIFTLAVFYFFGNLVAIW